LVDEGLAYADRLEAAGVPVERHHCAPMIHGYITMTGLFPRADREVDVFIASIRKQLQELPHG
jgi:acetyl esterase